MNWKTIETVSIVNSEGETENIQIQHDGNFYKIRNEFGNMSFDFNITSACDLIDTLHSIVTTDINKEVNDFLSRQDFEESICNENDIQSQLNLFENVNKLNDKSIGLDNKLNKTSNKLTK